MKRKVLKKESGEVLHIQTKPGTKVLRVRIVERTPDGKAVIRPAVKLDPRKPSDVERFRRAARRRGLRL